MVKAPKIAYTPRAPKSGECLLLNKIPPEIRPIIYELAWSDEASKISFTVHTTLYITEYGTMRLANKLPDLRLLAVSNKIRAEALPVYYGSVTFHLSVSIEANDRDRINHGTFESLGALNHMRHLKLTLCVKDNIWNEKTDDMGFSALSDLVVCQFNKAPRLAKLELCIIVDTATQYQLDLVSRILARLRSTASVECRLLQDKDSRGCDLSR